MALLFARRRQQRTAPRLFARFVGAPTSVTLLFARRRQQGTFPGLLAVSPAMSFPSTTLFAAPTTLFAAHEPLPFAA